ncbi:MAG: glycosyltransferase family 2 protein [Terriglobia bacterium]
MRWVFALSLAFIIWTYAGYPIWACLKSFWRPRPVHPAPIFPRISIVMAVRNEAHTLPHKMENLSTLNYPPGQREIIVVSDGSTDSTSEMLQRWESGNVRVLTLPCHQGKAAALNLGVQSASGEIIVFTDARQQIEPDAVRNLVANFADPEVGCVSGELMLGAGTGSEASGGVGLYWRLEKMIRQWESASGSVVGATGALYAARKELLTPLPLGTILDDVYNPLQVCRQGKRVIFEPRARAWDEIADSQREFSRKVRTLTGNYQLLQLAPWVLTRSNPVRFEFIAHKLMRLLVPLALIAFFISSLLIPGTLARVAVALQLIFYGLALLTLSGLRMGVLARLGDAALAFLLLNTAAAVALVYFLTGKKEVWAR